MTQVNNPDGNNWLPDVGQTLLRVVDLTVLGSNQFAVVCNPTVTVTIPPAITDAATAQHTTRHTAKSTATTKASTAPAAKHTAKSKATLMASTAEDVLPVAAPTTATTIKWGERQLRKGPATFFLHPNESLESGIQNAYILEEDQAILVAARARFDDVSAGDSAPVVRRRPGDNWLVHGKCSYIPPIQAMVVEVSGGFSMYYSTCRKLLPPL